jgi:Uma2 family endonuclease
MTTMQATRPKYYTPEEYLEQEEKADYKSEYLDGEIIPTAGGTVNHNRIAGNFYAALNFALRTQEYEVFIGDVRLWIDAKNIYTYPDVMVITGEPQYYQNRQDTVTNPTVIIEILSESTRDYDESGKFNAFRTLPSFVEYLLIDQAKVSVVHYTKTGEKQWSMREYDAEDEMIKFNTLEFEITLTDIYNKVKF